MPRKIKPGDRLYTPCPMFWGRIACYVITKVGAGYADSERYDDSDAKGKPIGNPVGYQLALGMYADMHTDPAGAARAGIIECRQSIAEAERDIVDRQADIQKLTTRLESSGELFPEDA